MSKSPQSLPAAVLDKIEAQSRRFEADAKAGKKPRLEAYLGSTAEPVRSALLQSLLRVELRLLGEKAPDQSAYELRFVQQVDIVRAVFQERQSPPETAAYVAPDTSVSRRGAGDATQDYRLGPPRDLLIVFLVEPRKHE